MTITNNEALTRTIEHREIFHDEMLSLVRRIMGGEMSPVMMAALLVGLRVKKETIGEITAAAQVMREFSTKVQVADRTHLVDIVGTGGDGSHTFNISTCSMFVAEAAGAKVSKHGGRSVSSKSGSADVLESLGIDINLKPDAIARGIQVRALQRLGAEHAVVVYGRDGMDEVSLGAATMVGELKNGEISEYEIHPEDFGLHMKSNRGLKVKDALESKEMLLEALANVEGTPREIVVLNAGTALYAAGVADSIGDGIVRARTAIASGEAKRKLDQFVALTQKFSSRAA